MIDKDVVSEQYMHFSMRWSFQIHLITPGWSDSYQEWIFVQHTWQGNNLQNQACLHSRYSELPTNFEFMHRHLCQSWFKHGAWMHATPAAKTVSNIWRNADIGNHLYRLWNLVAIRHGQCASPDCHRDRGQQTSRHWSSYCETVTASEQISGLTTSQASIQKQLPISIHLHISTSCKCCVMSHQKRVTAVIGCAGAL